MGLLSKPPCYGCKVRYFNCHSKCEDYKQWCENRKEYKEARLKNLKLDYEVELCKLRVKKSYRR